MSSFGERLRQLRAESGLTASAVARKLEVSVSTYRRWETGQELNEGIFILLAEILGVSLYTLFGKEPPIQKLNADLRELEGILSRMKNYS